MYTMFVALHGQLSPHPWRDPSSDSSDAYSQFYARSSAMGWLEGAVEGTPTAGTWRMNDAGCHLQTRPQPSRVAWFHVALAKSIPSDCPLPVQPFLACAGDVVARIGTLHLDTLQLLLPVHSLRPPDGTTSPLGSVVSLLKDAGWFTDRNPRAQTRVRVTLDTGQEPSIRSAAPEIFRQVREFDQDVFACETYALADETPTTDPELTDALWNGPPQHSATFRGLLAEWSLDALGWLAAYFATVGQLHGVDTSTLLTAKRVEDA